MHTDILKMLKSLKHDFPEIINLSSIGKTYQKRDMDLLTIDARAFLKKEYNIEYNFFQKPAIVLTGQHHSREFITSCMVLYSALNLIHGGIVHNNEKYR